MSRRRPRPLVTAGLVLAILGAYGLEIAGGGLPVCEAYGFAPERFLRTGDVLPALAYPLLHDPSNPMHLAGNVVMLGLFGALVERQLRAVRMLGVYLAAGIAGALGHLLIAPEATDPLVGNSGCVFALLAIAIDPRTLVFTALLFAANLVALFHPSPWLVPAPTSIGCHIGGFVCGALVVMLGRVRNAAEARRVAVV
jgi:membrane associated rhomboid family serine protease